MADLVYEHNYLIHFLQVNSGQILYHLLLFLLVLTVMQLDEFIADVGLVEHEEFLN